MENKLLKKDKKEIDTKIEAAPAQEQIHEDEKKLSIRTSLKAGKFRVSRQ